MNIDRASASVINELLELMRQQFLEHEIGFDPDQLEAAIRHLITDQGAGFVLAARDNSKLLGLAVISFAWTLEHGGKSAWLDELYVLPDHRNAGIGTLLLDQAIVEAKQAGCLAVDLEVDTVHRQAESLYERTGFRRLKRRRWAKRIA